MSLRDIKPALLVACLSPAAVLAVRCFGGTAGDNPTETITFETGDWSMLYLLATLAITPMRRITGINGLIGFRRMFGLMTFFYASLHLLTYVFLSQSVHFKGMLIDMHKRPFVLLGWCAFLMMVPLALTSNRFSIQRLGRRWTQLHRCVYGVAIIAVSHYVWMRHGEAKPYAYALLFLALLWWRVR